MLDTIWSTSNTAVEQYIQKLYIQTEGGDEIPTLMGETEKISKLHQVLESDISNIGKNKAGKER